MGNLLKTLVGRPLTFIKDDQARPIGKITSAEVSADGTAVLVQASVDDPAVQKILQEAAG